MLREAVSLVGCSTGTQRAALLADKAAQMHGMRSSDRHCCCRCCAPLLQCSPTALSLMSCHWTWSKRQSRQLVMLEQLSYLTQVHPWQAH